MRVLYLCHRIPYPPNKGDKIRAFHQVRAIGTRHEIDLFTLVDDKADLDYRTALNAYCRSVTVSSIDPKLARVRALPALLTGAPLTIPYFCSTELQAAVRKAIVKHAYDRIFVYCSAMAQYVERGHDIPVLTDLVDVDSDKWTQYSAHARFPMSAVYRREGRSLQEYERQVCEMSRTVVVTTQREAVLARQICSSANVHVITNGVDTGYFQTPEGYVPSTPPSIVFTGDMSYFPNEQAVIYFATTVLPLIRSKIPAVRFVIVGRNPGPKVRQLEKLPSVEVTGFVPDIRRYLAEARVSVAPFHIAAGIQNKILEAMSCGLPVVSTSRAIQGLSPSVAQIVRRADTTEVFASDVTFLLQNPEVARETGAEGRLRVTADYNWSRSQDLLLQLIDTPDMKAPAASYSTAAH